VSANTIYNHAEALWARPLLRPEAQIDKGKCAFISIWLFTIAIYARPEDIFPPAGQLHLTFLFGLCAGLAYLFALASGKVRVLWSPELRLVLILTAWYLAGVPFAIWRGGSLQTLIHVWLKTVFVFFLLTQTLLTTDRIRKILWAIILSELAVTSLSIARPSNAIWVGNRLVGINQGILGWNFLGVAAAVTIPYIAALFVARRGFVARTLLAATFASMAWMLMLTASRGGILSVVFSVVLTSLLVLRGTFQGKVVAVGIVTALAIAVSFAPPVFWERLGTVWGDEAAWENRTAVAAVESKQNHIFALDKSIEYTLENPIFGVGLGNFDVASGLELGIWMGTHNTFTQVSSEAGIPALILFISLPLIALLRLVRIRRILSGRRELAELALMTNASISSLLSFAFSGLFAHLAYDYYFFYPLAIAVGLRGIALTSNVTPASPKTIT
jgi:O-antigen ligase